MILRQITPPAQEPLTLSDVEGQCRITDLSAEAPAIDRFIKAIRQRCESITKRALITQQWEMDIDAFPLRRNPLEIPLPPLQSVDLITYIDADGLQQVLDPALYRVIASKSDNCQPGYIIPAYLAYWPVALGDDAVITIAFTCGYEQVPAAIQQWCLLQVANMYEHRETTQVGNRLTLIELKTLADGLLEDYRVYGPF